MDQRGFGSGVPGSCNLESKRIVCDTLVPGRSLLHRKGAAMSGLDCPYCGEAAQLVTGAVLYPHRPDLADRNFWQCEPCDAYVGCHKKGSWRFVAGQKIRHRGDEPLGRLANAQLRTHKKQAHYVFDPIWQSGELTRAQAYKWLAGHMGLPVDDMHIGCLDVDECRRVVNICRTVQRTAEAQP